MMLQRIINSRLLLLRDTHGRVHTSLEILIAINLTNLIVVLFRYLLYLGLYQLLFTFTVPTVRYFGRLLAITIYRHPIIERWIRLLMKILKILAGIFQLRRISFELLRLFQQLNSFLQFCQFGCFGWVNLLRLFFCVIINLWDVQ